MKTRTHFLISIFLATLWLLHANGWAESIYPSINDTTGFGMSVNKSGEFGKPNAKFFGGVSLAEGTFVVASTANTASKLALRATIQVDPVHIGKNADLLLVIGTEPKSPQPYSGGVSTVYATIDENLQASPVDLYASVDTWMPQLRSFKGGITLGETVEVDLGVHQFSTLSMRYIFIGYRLYTPEDSAVDGMIVYNSVPIMVDVNEIIEESPARYCSIPEPGSVINFGNHPIGESSVQTVAISECGEADLTVNLLAVTNDGEFEIVDPNFPLTVANDVGAEKVIQVQCTPLVEGLRTAELQFSTNDPINQIVSYKLECTGELPAVATIPATSCPEMFSPSSDVTKFGGWQMGEPGEL